jgi:hypothetical protein
MFGQPLRLARLHAPGPARAWKRQCRAQHLLQKLFAVLVLAQKIADAVREAAAPAALGFGPPDPAAEFGGFERRQMAGEGRVRRIEQMMALVEDDAADAAGGCFFFLGRGHAQRMVDGGLVQHQRVVGDDDRGIAPGAHRTLDEAAAVMRAGGIDAFAAPVGKAQRLRGDAAALAVERKVVEQRQDPGGEVAPHHVAVAREPRPARDERGEQGRARVGGGQPPEHLLHVEEADIVLAALADHDPGTALLRVLDQA